MSSFRHTFAQLMGRDFSRPSTADGIKELIDDNILATKTAKVALAAVDTAGGMFAWQNPEAVKIDIVEMIVFPSTATTGACTMDAGVAANGTTLDDTLLDGVDMNATALKRPSLALATLDANGGTTDYVTGSKASGASAGVVGFVYIVYKKQATS